MIQKVLVFAGSNRSGSVNRTLAFAASGVLARMQAEVDVISLEDYPLPLFDVDLEMERGVPENAVKLARLFAAHDAVFIASPELNSSIPPLLKNALDWVARVRSDGFGQVHPFAGLTVALGSVSDAPSCGLTGLFHLRAVLMHFGAQVVSEQCAMRAGQGLFGADGLPAEEAAARQLDAVCRSLLDHSTPGRAR